MNIEFIVSGDLPPKKDGANSMWGKPTETTRLIALRRAALAAIQGKSLLRHNIGLYLEVRLSEATFLNGGDLDNFVTGVCDGLQAANPKAKLAPAWSFPENHAIHPENPIALIDDGAVIYIKSRKFKTTGEVGYKVILEGESESTNAPTNNG